MSTVPLNIFASVLLGNFVKNGERRHQAREAEPKNYDISKDDTRDLCRATYKRIGDVTDGSLPETTYQDHSKQILRKAEFEERESKHPMVTAGNFANAQVDRDTGAPDCGYGAVLPQHHPEHDKRHLDTTHLSDYKPPYPYTPALEQPQDFPDNSNAYKKCHSQFTDTADYRRPGRNTWSDESGLYANSHYKAQLYTKTNTIPERLQ